MNEPQIDSPGELQRSLELLAKNWTLAIPTAIAGLISACVFLFFVAGALAAAGGGVLLANNPEAGKSPAAIAAGLSLLSTLALIFPILVLVSWIAHAIVIAASRGVWHGAPVDLGGALNATLAKIGPLLGAGILLALMFLFSCIIPIVGFLAIAFFSIYTVPAIILGNANGWSAISESFALAKNNSGPTFILFFAIVIAYVVGAIVDSVVGKIPILNLFAGFFVGGAVAGFVALATARFYEVLSGISTPIPVGPATYATAPGSSVMNP